MSSRVVTLSSTPQDTSKVRRRSDGPNHEQLTKNDSFNITDGRNDIFNFLHNDLRIPSETCTQYCNVLMDNGYDDVSSLQDATEIDFKEMGVKIGHVRRIKRAIFSNRMMRKHDMQILSDVSILANETVEEENAIEPLHHSIEGALLSDFARREFISSRENSLRDGTNHSKENLIRKQAEKIALLEARLAHMDLNEDMKSSLSCGSSIDTHSRRLTPEERLRIHKERKMQDEKYKEQCGKWDAPPPKKNGKKISTKVKENDDFVLKLTSNASFRRRIDEEEKLLKKSARMQPSRKVAQRQMRSDINTSPSVSEREIRRHGSPMKIKCDTCCSTCDCEEDIDNPGTYYCKSCWEEYEENDILDVTNVSRPQVNQSDIASSPEVHRALWIVHDNPQLGEKIIYSGPRQMECMLETKDPRKKDCVRIVIGNIDYSGKVRNSGIGNMQGVESEQGTECIRIRNTRGYYIDHNQVATRLSRDKTVYEFHLGNENALVLTGEVASKSIKEFFKDCYGAIDVILDPQRDAGGWYPQKEAHTGGRKIAPQFRSKGVGYIRLGDDMSENGLAFLSVNACSAFLSPSGDATPVTTTNKLSSFSTPTPTLNVAIRKIKSDRINRPPVRSSTMDDSDEESLDDEVQSTENILKQLQNADESSIKWKDKADLISLLGKGVSKQEWSHLRPQALNILENTLGGKNTNVHVIRSALIAAGMIGISMGGELVHQNSWKTIMIETIKLLKNKQCGLVAKTVLAQLHGRCFTLANSLEMVTHVLGLGSVASACKGKKSRSRVTETPKLRRLSTMTPNNIEVVEWLADITHSERRLEMIDPILDTSSLNVLVDLFLTHADHRDQLCRKSATYGLINCMLYGAKNLGIEIAHVARMLSGLKESNPKLWNQIVQNASAILEDEISGWS